MRIKPTGVPQGENPSVFSRALGYGALLRQGYGGQAFPQGAQGEGDNLVNSGPVPGVIKVRWTRYEKPLKGFNFLRRSNTP